MKTFLAAAGVILSTAGALLLWVFVKSLAHENTAEVLKGGDVVFTIPKATPEYRKTVAMRARLVRFGGLCVVAGGVFQLVSLYVPE